MAPGTGGLPAAEREVEVSGRVAAFLASASPRALGRIRLGLRAFELLPFPWRFSRLDPGAQADFLRRMEGSRLGLHHELLLMAKVLTTVGYAADPRVEAAVGARTECRLADGSLPRPPPLTSWFWTHMHPKPGSQRRRGRNATWWSSGRGRVGRWRRRPWPRPGSM